MLALLTDENFNVDILNGMRRRLPALDAIRVEDIGLRQTDDAVILERAAALGRVLVTSDVQRMVGFAYQRISLNLPMAGLIAVPMFIRVHLAIEDLLIYAYCCEPEELAGQVRWVPIRH